MVLASLKREIWAGRDRKHSVEFREADVRPVLDGGRSVLQVALDG